MALTDKLIAIAEALRDKTTNYVFEYSEAEKKPYAPKDDKYTLEQMVETIQTHCPNRVKKVFVKGNFDKVDASFGLIVSYTPEGIVVLTAKSYTDSGEYEHILWKLRNTPEGVGIIVGNTPSSQTNGERGQLISCLLTGITQNCRLTIEQTDTSSSNDYTEISIDIEYI